jgi:glycosyltransferase involved in cell wall biosynthesis
MNRQVKYSIVVPVYNEAQNVTPLYARLTQVMEELDEPYEIVFIDDGSKDGTANILHRISGSDSRVQVILLRRNFGQTPALKAGFDAARGDIIISMDGDLQHDPEEIPAFVEKLEDGYDIVSGWRAQRRDTWLTRRLPSRIANWMMAKLSGVALHDFGTTFKAYRRETIKNIPLYGELHRFIPALAAFSGARIAEIPINNPPRKNGKSNYGISRTLHVFLDLLSIKFLLDYSTRPLHFFGPIGLLSTGAGVLTGCLSILSKVFGHEAMLAPGPLFMAATLLILAGILILCLGLATEILSRTYYESQGKPIYAVRTTISRDALPMQHRLRRVEPAFTADDSAEDDVRAVG